MWIRILPSSFLSVPSLLCKIFLYSPHILAGRLTFKLSNKSPLVLPLLPACLDALPGATQSSCFASLHFHWATVLQAMFMNWKASTNFEAVYGGLGRAERLNPCVLLFMEEQLRQESPLKQLSHWLPGAQLFWAQTSQIWLSSHVSWLSIMKGTTMKHKHINQATNETALFRTNNKNGRNSTNFHVY